MITSVQCLLSQEGVTVAGAMNTPVTGSLLGLTEQVNALQCLLAGAQLLRGLRRQMQQPLSKTQAAALDIYFARTVEASGRQPACFAFGATRLCETHALWSMCVILTDSLGMQLCETGCSWDACLFAHQNKAPRHLAYLSHPRVDI